MFTLTRLLADTPPGSLQPTQLHIGGFFSCPGGAGGVPVELRVLSPAGGPTTTFTATTSAGGPTSPPVESLTISIPAWAAATCENKLIFEVRGNCGGTWTPWQRESAPIECLSCPRMSLQVSYGACSGTPVRQSVTLTATVMIPPGASVPFTWNFGDGTQAPAGVVTNNTATSNTPFTLTTTHDYDASGSYTACLVPPVTSECPQVCIGVDPDCAVVGCPAVALVANVGPCNANFARPVTYTLTLTPPVPMGSSVQVMWAYGGPDVTGAASASQVVNTAGAPVSSITHTATFAPRASGYTTTATVFLVVGGQACPIGTSTATVTVSTPSCLPCPDPANPVTVSLTTPNSPSWCAPVGGTLAASIGAQVNWAQPVPANPPQPVRYDWTITLPDARVAVQTSTGHTVSTSSGWSGPGSINGGIDLHGAGTYAIGVIAQFGPGAGLPTDANGVISCHLQGTHAFTLAACQGTKPCPSLGSLSASSACADPARQTVANITVTASVSDPAAIVQSYVWDFGDPGSSGNQLTTTGPSASHAYANPGTYTVTTRVQLSEPCAGTQPGPATVTVTIPTCSTDTPPRETRWGCDFLLWLSLILILLSGILAVVGCILSNSFPIVGAVLGIIAIVLLVVGLLLFLLWWAICRFFTRCEVILAALRFMGILVAVFSVVGAVLAFLAKFVNTSLWACVGASFFQSAIWGLLLWILGEIAVAVGCLVANPGGSNPPPPPSSSSSSSSGLTSSGGTRAAASHAMRMDRRVGLGDLVALATTAVGIRPCEACHRRAQRLNELGTVRLPQR